MKLQEFKRWIGEMCMFYTRPNWPTDENVTQSFRDVQYMDGKALETIGSYIRSNYEEWPKSISLAMRKGYTAWEEQRAEEQRRKEAQASTYTPPTPEQAALNVSRCRDILHALRTGTRPPWADEPRAT